MFSWTNFSLQGLAVLFGAGSIPGSDVPCQDILNGTEVEIDYLSGYPEFLTASEAKQSLTCLFHYWVCMQYQGQTLRDGDIKVLKVNNPLHWGAIDIKAAVVPSQLLPKVFCQLLSVADIQY